VSKFHSNPEDLVNLLQSADSSLAKITQKTNVLFILANIVQETCPDLPTDAWKIANFRDNTLIIEAKSPVWGQRLQFERNKITQKLINASDGLFQKIEIKVTPPGQSKTIIATNEQNLPTRKLSKNAANHIQTLANSAPESLKNKLLKLAKHANKK
jgi:hypothetical protein